MIDVSGCLTLLAGGDVAPVRQPVDRLADLVQPVLDQADVRFVQCERTYSTRGTFHDWTTIPNGRWSRLDPEYASVFRAARADVISVASNHALDFGYEALEDSMSMFRGWGCQVIGAGRTGTEARQPAIVSANGVTVAILSYCSVARDGQAAVGDHPGVAMVRARTWYGPPDSQPGCPPLILSEALPEDVEAMAADIRAAKERADAVMVSFHWGIRFVPKVLATYQQPLAHAAIDAGADVIVGHHPHALKAVEVYNGRVCLYSVGNYLSTGSLDRKPHAEWNLYWVDAEPSSLYSFADDCRPMVLPKITFSRQGVDRVALLLGYINDLAQPRVLTVSDPTFGTVLDKLEWVSDFVPHRFAVEGDEVVVSAP